MRLMKTCTAMISLLSLLLLPTFSAAQQRTDPAAPQRPVPTAPQRTDPAAPKRVEPGAVHKMDGIHTNRASKFIGADVENAQGEDLGQIEDLMLDPQDGRVAYAVLSFGGFLGLGEKYFAVPWKALQAKAGEDDTLILNVEKEKLTNAPGFDKNNWPDMTNRQWGEEIHTYYGVPPYWVATTRPVGGSMTGMQASEAVTATILNVDKSTKSLQLKTANNETVELKAPEGLLGELQVGDRVEVVIRKQAK
jgi:sporulation protein YlmC with PRC-barrel domain